jgi:PAS domain S-box-containing protein
MKQLMVTNLKTGGELGIDEGKPIYLCIGVRKDWKTFRNILQKGMRTIGEDEINNLRNKWLEFTEKQGIALTREERMFLAKHPNLRLGVDPAWPPFEFVDQKGNYAGITSGFVEAISDRLGIKMTPVPGLTWSQAHEKLKAGEIDLHPGVIRTPEREKYMNFTKPYLSFPIVTASNKNTPIFGTIQDLKGYRVGVVKDYYTEDILRHDHPYLKLVTYPTLSEALQELDAGHIDAFIDNLVVINQEINRSGLENIRISAPTAYAVDLSFGVRKDLPELIGILNKAIDDITSQEKSAIKSTWMTDVEVKVRFDYKAIMAWAIPIGGSVILIIVFIVVWNRRLGREITERKRTEAQLEQAEERSRLLLESASEGIFGVGQDGLVNFINPAGLKMLGFDAEELIGQKIHPLVHHSRTDGTPYPVEECPMYQSLIQGTTGNPDGEVLWRKDGTSFYVEYTSVPIRKNGSIAGTVVVFRDISERKEAEEAVRKSEAQLSSILKTTKQGFWLVDNDTRTLEVNDAMCEILDRPREELMGRKVYDFLDEKNRAKVRKQERMRSESKQSLYEVSLLRPDETLVPCLVNASPLFDGGGNKIGSFGMFTDITDQKQMEVTLKRNVAELERFNKLAVGREKKMIQLKEEINELLCQSNQDKKYKIVK